MFSSNQQNKTHLRTVVNIALLAGITASFAWACVSAGSDNNGSGGNGGESATGGANNGGNGATGGANNAGGGASGVGGSSSVDCPASSKAVSGNTCTVNPPIFTLNPTGCSFGTWDMTNNELSGGLAIWGGLTQSCEGGVYHVTGSYAGFLVANTGGNAGITLFYNAPTDAGVGCSILNASNYKGLTLDIDPTSVPGNQLIVGVETADGNAAETTLALTAGKQSKQIPWGSLKKKANCGPDVQGNITLVYYVFGWFNDTATHAVDVTLSNVGFY